MSVAVGYVNVSFVVSVTLIWVFSSEVDEIVIGMLRHCQLHSKVDDTFVEKNWIVQWKCTPDAISKSRRTRDFGLSCVFSACFRVKITFEKAYHCKALHQFAERSINNYLSSSLSSNVPRILSTKIISTDPLNNVRDWLLNRRIFINVPSFCRKFWLKSILIIPRILFQLYEF